MNDIVDRIIFQIGMAFDRSELWESMRREPHVYREAVRIALSDDVGQLLWAPHTVPRDDPRWEAYETGFREGHRTTCGVEDFRELAWALSEDLRSEFRWKFPPHSNGVEACVWIRSQTGLSLSAAKMLVEVLWEMP